MKSIKINLYIITALLPVFLGCQKQIEVQPPITKVVAGNVFADNNTATAAMLGIYAQLGDFPESLHRITAWSSDELFAYGTGNPTVRDFFGNNLVVGDAPNFWALSYNYIFQNNSIIENLQLSTTLDPKIKKQLLGEAQFMRAYFYFNLVNLYGDVPIAITSDYSITGSLSRAPKIDVYQQIIRDLQSAQGNLSSKFVDGSDTTQTSDRIRPTSWAADALLSRVYLYIGAGNFDKAEVEATKVISNTTLFGLPTDLNGVFKMNSNEAIWQLANYSGTDLTFTFDGARNIMSAPPAGSSNFNSSTISAQLLNSFETGDQRKLKWIGTFSNSSDSWNYPAKYKDNALTATVPTEYTMIFRLAEQFLIRAEARAQQGKLIGVGSAIEDLNTIRHRAGLSDYSGGTDLPSVLAAINHERQVELFDEGDRWFNLKRTGAVDGVMNLVTPTKLAGQSWNSIQQLYPIPATDLVRDKNLVQNPGY